MTLGLGIASHILLQWWPTVIPLEQMPFGGQSIDLQHGVPIDGDVLLVAEIVRLDLVQQLLVQRVMQCIPLATLTPAALPFSGVEIWEACAPYNLLKVILQCNTYIGRALGLLVAVLLNVFTLFLYVFFGNI